MSDFDHKEFLKSLTSRPGVYRMIGEDGRVLYVGKAKNLKRRVSSYFGRAQNRRIQIMVSQILDIQVTVTNTEAEALILENNLIKSLKPRYNVLLRDDKSYPYIFLSDGPFPRLAYHRGARKGKGRYFGPYPSGGAVRETLHLLQKVFPVRQCEDSFFRNRTRPCLQYQIKRCSGPCVGLVTEEAYQRDVRDTCRFLEGRAFQVIDDLVERMSQASADLEFEEAAHIRDQIISLRRVQERQYVSGEKGDLDIVACRSDAGIACIQLFTVRGGRNLGNRSWFPKVAEGVTEDQVVGAFLAQHYLEKPVPKTLLVSHRPADYQLLEEAFSRQLGKQVKIRSSVRGERRRWLQLAEQNAESALAARLADRSGIRDRYESLQEALGLDEVPERMECFDISHMGGEKTVASCVVFDQNGPLKSAYRRFNIRSVNSGDDYAAMAEAISRRYKKIGEGEEKSPDLLIIDGGKGQLGSAAEILQEFGINDVRLLGIAKGADRKAGMERLFLLGEEAPRILAPDSPALHLLQQIRDEAHRFAITGHRQRRGKARQRSILEDIPGVGAKRRRQLLQRFGGLHELSRAGVEDIAAVEGISKRLATRIYEVLHGD